MTTHDNDKGVGNTAQGICTGISHGQHPEKKGGGVLYLQVLIFFNNK